MNCDRARGNIIAYLKGELTESKKVLFEEHLARCPACRRELESGRRLLSWTEAASEQAVVKKVESVIESAIKARASAIHLDSLNDNSLRVRYRIDSALQDAVFIDSVQRSGVIARIKMMADLEASETLVFQEGRMPWKQDGLEFTILVSACPFAFGEGIVLRLLDRNAPLLGLEKLSFCPEHLQAMRGLVKHSGGIFFTTGPTGSGKTTTLYSLLLEFNRPEVKIVSIEDPVEYTIDGVSHSQVRAKDGYTFAVALRSLLRQDPDVIMIGEIRDVEVAELALMAATTGHTVLSQLHTNTAIGSVQRLRDVGVENYLIAGGITGALNQRLVGRTCKSCKKRVVSVSPAMHALKITESDLQSHEVLIGTGCESCRGTGRRGRLPIYELWLPDQTQREMIGQGDLCEDLLTAAKERGFKPILDDARRKVLDGLTTAEECIQALGTSG